MATGRCWLQSTIVGRLSRLMRFQMVLREGPFKSKKWVMTTPKCVVLTNHKLKRVSLCSREMTMCQFWISMQTDETQTMILMTLFSTRQWPWVYFKMLIRASSIALLTKTTAWWLAKSLGITTLTQAAHTSTFCWRARLIIQRKTLSLSLTRTKKNYMVQNNHQTKMKMKNLNQICST